MLNSVKIMTLLALSLFLLLKIKINEKRFELEFESI